ncbi:LuxR C-terminal-related transcriptional regulator [Paenibacillus sp. SC116]|uniref:LuxR C-terminal-related transcriptional regulator n=1 Tax=Paenibacillus sp. SC116 TaxID=2968986 RepID=UPI00215B756E|nr:LuxR C-terminal-related transcriptional regulator [Paenibacillus sp. SC116]MCR8842471.1 LuxR C-terminal-related transcriptional regulator [Paenibacillus sp. SC116]
MFIQIKIEIPQARRSMVSRPRLVGKFNEGLESKLTLVSAQAGYGKTTALGTWAKQCGVPVAWVSLDKLDNDWTTFWNCILTSIRKRVPGFGEKLGFLLEMESAASFEPGISALLNELQQLDDSLVLVLDDYHVIDLQAIHHSLSYLLEYLPPHVHLYIASRVELAFPTARLMAKGEMVQINMKDLQFNLDEGVIFFRDMMKISLTNDQIFELFRQTEGWVSGLQLAAITLKRSSNIAASIRQFNGQQRHISSYLLEEVYGNLSESMQQFLLATSLLSRMNRDLCQAVTDQKDSQGQLERLEQLNLFLIPLDDRHEWYRYHHLLSDFLQQIIARDNPEQLRQFHVRAASWFESQSLNEDAIEHYIKAQQVEDAVRLIESLLPELMKSKVNVLIRWITSLPESSYEHKPLFEIFYISKLIEGGDWNKALQRAEQAEKRFESLKAVIPELEWKQLMGNLYYFCGIICYLKRDVIRTSHYFEQLDYYLPEGGSFQNYGSNRYQDYYLFTDLLSLNNDLHVVEQFLLKWIHVWGEREHYPFVGYLYISYCMLHYEWNNLEEAELYLGQAMKREDLQTNIWMRVQLHLISSWLQLALGRGSEAIESLTRFSLTIESPDYDLIMRRIKEQQAHLFLRQGQVQKTIDWSEQNGLSYRDEVSLHRMEEYLVLARVLAVSERIEEAIHLIDNLERLVEKENYLRLRIKLLVVKCTVLWYSDQPREAFEALKAALWISEPTGYIRSFIDEGPVMEEMLSNLEERHEPGSRAVPFGYISKLLHAFRARHSDRLSRETRLTDQEENVLDLIAEGLLNKEIASRLQISVDTVKFHVKNIYRKLGVQRRTQAIQHAKQNHSFK